MTLSAALPVLAAALAIQPAAIASGPDRAVTPAISPPAKQDKMVCRRVDETGSLIGGKRECHTQSVWDQMARDGSSLVNAYKTRAQQQGARGGG